MKINIKIILFLVPIIFAGISFAQSAESFTVNGLKVIFKYNNATDIVSSQMYFKGGVSILEPEQAGIEALTLNTAADASKN